MPWHLNHSYHCPNTVISLVIKSQNVRGRKAMPWRQNHSYHCPNTVISLEIKSQHVRGRKATPWRQNHSYHCPNTVISLVIVVQHQIKAPSLSQILGINRFQTPGGSQTECRVKDDKVKSAPISTSVATTGQETYQEKHSAQSCRW